MKHKRLQKAKDREWLQPKRKGFLMGCCDCGLVHRMDFVVVKDGKVLGKEFKVQFRASRARNYTAAQRRRERIVVK